MVTVAQLVESRIVIPVVVGSSPIGHPRIPKKPAFTAGFFSSQKYRIIALASPKQHDQQNNRQWDTDEP